MSHSYGKELPEGMGYRQTQKPVSRTGTNQAMTLLRNPKAGACWILRVFRVQQTSKLCVFGTLCQCKLLIIMYILEAGGVERNRRVENK